MARPAIPTWYVALVATPPNTRADEESRGAAYLSLDEARERTLRGAELGILLESVLNGRQVFPLELLGREMSV